MSFIYVCSVCHQPLQGSLAKVEATDRSLTRDRIIHMDCIRVLEQSMEVRVHETWTGQLFKRQPSPTERHRRYLREREQTRRRCPTCQRNDVIRPDARQCKSCATRERWKLMEKGGRVRTTE